MTTAAAPQGISKTFYHYDQAGHLIAETTPGNTPQATYIWNGDVLTGFIVHQPARTVYTVQTDHLGSPFQVRTLAGQVVWRWESEAFGQTAPNEDVDGDGNKLTLNLRFPGQYFDRESGLHYNWNRYYSPKLARYLSSDPIGLAGGLNMYAYVEGNPVSYSDPLGLFCGSGWNDPFVPDSFPGKVDFSNACKKHDTCYDTCGASKHTCDQNFLTDMLKECGRQPPNSIARNQCQSTATWYWEAVISMGQGAFNEAQKSCQQCQR